MIRKLFALPLVLACALLPVTSMAQSADKDKKAAEAREKLHKDAVAAVDRLKKADPGVERFFKESAGYVVFPTVGKVGFIIGGGHGDGELYEKGNVVGIASVTSASVGLQAGAQEYSEIVFLQDAAAVERFKQNKFEFDASASAVLAKLGASKSANYRNGVVVFIQAKGGAMAEAAVGGQKFKFQSK